MTSFFCNAPCLTSTTCEKAGRRAWLEDCESDGRERGMTCDSDQDFDRGVVDEGDGSFPSALRRGESGLGSRGTISPIGIGAGGGLGDVVSREVAVDSWTPDISCLTVPVLNKLDHDPRDEFDVDNKDAAVGALGPVGEIDERRGQPGDSTAARGSLTAGKLK